MSRSGISKNREELITYITKLRDDGEVDEVFFELTVADNGFHIIELINAFKKMSEGLFKGIESAICRCCKHAELPSTLAGNMVLMAEGFGFPAFADHCRQIVVAFEAADNLMFFNAQILVGDAFVELSKKLQHIEILMKSIHNEVAVDDFDDDPYPHESDYDDDDDGSGSGSPGSDSSASAAS